MLAVTVKDLNVKEDKLALASKIANQYAVVNGKVFGILNRNEASEDLGKTARTITRWVNDLKEIGFILSNSVKGGSGGFGIYEIDPAFTDIDTTKDTIETNPYIADNFNAEQFKSLFLVKPKVEPKRSYRSKEEIRKEKIRNRRKFETEERLNNELINMEYIPREWWDNFKEHKDLYFRAWTLAKMYDAIKTVTIEQLYTKVLIAEKERDDYNSEWFVPNTDLSYLKHARRVNKNKSVLQKDFIGTADFTTFLKLAVLLEEEKANPVDYLAKQFDFVVWKFESDESYVKGKLQFPYVNTLISSNAVARYLTARDKYKEWSLKYPLYYHVTTDPTRTDINTNYPVIQALRWAYEKGSSYNEEADIETYLEANNANFLLELGATREVAVKKFYAKAKEAIESTDNLTDEERKEITMYTKRNVALLINDKSPVFTYLLNFPETVEYMINYAKYNRKVDFDSYYKYLGNIGRAFGDTYKVSTENYGMDGYRLDISMDATPDAYSTVKTASEYLGMHTDKDVLKSAMEKVGTDIFPVAQDGIVSLYELVKLYANGENLLGKMSKPNQFSYVANRNDIFNELTKWYYVMVKDNDKRRSQGEFEPNKKGGLQEMLALITG